MKSLLPRIIPEQSVKLTEDVAFAITADAGELEYQAELLVRSISRNCPAADIVVFIPERSKDDIRDNPLELFESAGEVVYGQIPIPDYPISALIQSFIEAEKLTNTKYIVALDTDTLLLQPMCIDDKATVWLRTADVGAQYWGSADARNDWKQLYEWFGLELPRRDEYVTASVDGRSIPPYWNSGVVITTDQSLPSRWLNYTKTLFYEDELPVSQDEFFIDQLALALAVRENVVVTLSEKENFPLGGQVWTPTDVSILHYGDRRNLSRVIPMSTRRRLAELEAVPPVTPTKVARSCLDIASTQSGKVLSYRMKNRIREKVKKILPRSILEI